MKPENKEQEFLVELEKLTRKYGLAVDGCGCCGSPNLIELDEEALDEKAGYAECVGHRDFAWVSPDDQYDWERAGHKIIKGSP